MNITFTLTVGSASTAAGPFNISGTTDTNATSELATGITKNQLSTGHTINSVNDLITGGTIASTGTCTTTTPWSVTPPCYCYTVTNLTAERMIQFEYNRCSDGVIVTMSVPQGTTRSVCVQANGDVIDTSGELTITACSTTCTVNAECQDCS